MKRTFDIFWMERNNKAIIHLKFCYHQQALSIQDNLTKIYTNCTTFHYHMPSVSPFSFGIYQINVHMGLYTNRYDLQELVLVSVNINAE